MPRYYNRYRNRPRYRRRKYYTRKTKTTAGKALRIARYARRIAKSELKYKDNVVAGPTAITQNPANARYWDINCPVLGAEVYKRIGNQCRNIGLQGRVDLNWNSGGANVQRVHIMVLNYPQSRNTSIAMGEYFTSDSIFEPMRNVEYIKSFRTLFAKTYTLEKTNKEVIHAYFNKKLNFNSRYSAGNGDYTDVSQGLIQMFMWSDQAANQPTYSALSTRWKFTDA